MFPRAIMHMNLWEMCLICDQTRFEGVCVGVKIGAGMREVRERGRKRERRDLVLHCLK